MITTLLFDLDGTLLPMDTEVFTKHYFSLLVQKLAPYGYEAKPLIGAVLAGIEAMAVNDGSVRTKRLSGTALRLSSENRRESRSRYSKISMPMNFSR